MIKKIFHNIFKTAIVVLLAGFLLFVLLLIVIAADKYLNPETKEVVKIVNKTKLVYVDKVMTPWDSLRTYWDYYKANSIADTFLDVFDTSTNVEQNDSGSTKLHILPDSIIEGPVSDSLNTELLKFALNGIDLKKDFYRYQIFFLGQHLDTTRYGISLEAMEDKWIFLIVDYSSSTNSINAQTSYFGMREYAENIEHMGFFRGDSIGLATTLSFNYEKGSLKIWNYKCKWFSQISISVGL